MRRPWSRLVLAGVAVVVLALAAAASSGFGYRLGLWPLRTGFTVLQWSGWVAAAGAGVCFIGCVLAIFRRRRGVMAGALALAAGLALMGWLSTWQQVGRLVPPIHDITTDTVNPPAFVALLETRQKAPNGAAYGGPAVAARQAESYPDIQPLRLTDPPARAFERALAAAQALGWTVAAAVPAEGRIEASDRTRWFGFIDDIVIRVTPDGAGSRIDVRSVSRLGRSDLGKNASRIRAYLARVQAG